MPPKRKVETVEDNTEVPPAKKTSEEETPPISPDKGATGETTTSSENKQTGMQTGLSEEEKKARLDEIEWDAIIRLMNSIKARVPEVYKDIVIETLYKHFAWVNRATRSKELIFSELDKLEARETEYYETSGRVPKWLTQELKDAQEDVEFENYVTLLNEARAQFGREMECAVILYINKHKGEHYCLGCMGHRDKP